MMELLGVVIIFSIGAALAIASRRGAFDGFRMDRYRCGGCRQYFTARQIEAHEKHCAEQVRQGQRR